MGWHIEYLYTRVYLWIHLDLHLFGFRQMPLDLIYLRTDRFWQSSKVKASCQRGLDFNGIKLFFTPLFVHFCFFFFFILFTLCLQTRLVLWRRPKKPFYHFYLAFLHFWELLQSYDNWFLVGWVWHLAVIWVAVEPKGFQVSLTKQLKTTPDWHCPCFFSFFPKMQLSEGSNLPHFPCHFSILKLWLLAFN